MVVDFPTSSSLHLASAFSSLVSGFFLSFKCLIPEIYVFSMHWSCLIVQNVRPWYLPRFLFLRI